MSVNLRPEVCHGTTRKLPEQCVWPSKGHRLLLDRQTLCTAMERAMIVAMQQARCLCTGAFKESH